jgi:hypothetical protein
MIKLLGLHMTVLPDFALVNIQCCMQDLFEPQVIMQELVLFLSRLTCCNL